MVFYTYSCIGTTNTCVHKSAMPSQTRERERECVWGARRGEGAPWGMMAKLLWAVSQLGWLARCVSVRFVRRLTAWSRRDKARPTLPPGFCSGLISYPPRRGIPGASLRGVFRDSRPHTACTDDLSTYLRDTAYDLVPVPDVCAISPPLPLLSAGIS